MMLHVPAVLTKDEVLRMRGELHTASWENGSRTAGAQAAQVKRNMQLPGESAPAQAQGRAVLQALRANSMFVSAALPKTLLPPLFNRYENGGCYGNHVDGAVRYDVGGEGARTDVSVTVFLSEPEEYTGGELVVEDAYGTHEVKLPAGDAIVYPATSLHRVEPVTHGVRLAACLWAQSMVRDDWRRHMLFDLDMTIVRLRQQLGETPDVVRLASHYHNLLRQWADL